MPIYEFTCETCGQPQEELVAMGTTEIPCARCGGPAKKSVGSYLFAAHGLENGHNAARAARPGTRAPEVTGVSGDD